MFNLLIILGSPNTLDGELLPMATGRLDKGYEIFIKKCNETWRITLTGGYGDHFNKTKKPHADYAKDYLFKKGLHETNFTLPALSCDTVDDAKKCIPIVHDYQPDEIVVVTSDFHLERVRYIFTTIFFDKKLSFFGSDYLNSCDEETKRKLLNHENRELKSLKKYGRSKLMDIPLA